MHSHVLPMPAVHLDRRLAHRAARRGRSTPWRPGRPTQRVGGLEVVDRPRRVQRDAERALHQAPRLGEQVLHRLERPDRHAVLPALRRVRHGDVEHAPHHADEVGAGERQAERGPRREVVVGEEPPLLGDGVHRCAGRDRPHRHAVRSAPPAAGAVDRRSSASRYRGPRARGRARAGRRCAVDDRRDGVSASVGARQDASDRRHEDRRHGIAGAPARRARGRAPRTGPANATSAEFRRARRRRSPPRPRPRAGEPSPGRRAARASRRRARPRRAACARGRVVELGHGRGSELARELAGRAPELRLLGRVTGVHRRESSYSVFENAILTGASATTSGDGDLRRAFAGVEVRAPRSLGRARRRICFTVAQHVAEALTVHDDVVLRDRPQGRPRCAVCERLLEAPPRVPGADARLSFAEVCGIGHAVEQARVGRREHDHLDAVDHLARSGSTASMIGPATSQERLRRLRASAASRYSGRPDAVRRARSAHAGDRVGYRRRSMWSPRWITIGEVVRVQRAPRTSCVCRCDINPATPGLMRILRANPAARNRTPCTRS